VPGIGFTGARLYSTMAMRPGAFSFRWESLLVEATLFADQEYLMMMVSCNAEMFLCFYWTGSLAVLIQVPRLVLFHEFV
jgi:hypothetical protein